jgi:hypothetical protein
MTKIPYKVRDSEGNTFVFAGYSSGHPVYRGQGGSKNIFEEDLKFYDVLEQEHPE